jgi:hypothetical protein
MICKKALIYTFSINLFFLALCLVFGKLRFGALDDYFMSGILSGMYGEGFNVHLIFVNVLYGYALLPFYYIFPRINWYYIGEMASVFISLTVVGYIIIRKTGDKWGSVLTALLVALCASDFYLALQFTQCAAILSAVGMLAFIYGFDKLSESIKYSKSELLPIALGILLLWWGSWMRWHAFLMGMPFFCGALMFQIKKFWKIKWAVFIGVLVVFIGAYGFQQFDRSLYQTPEYKKYMDFQGPRALLGDGKNYNQQAVYEDLEELGYSGKDFALLKSWTFYDKDVFAAESIRVITDVIGPYVSKNSVQLYPMMILSALKNFVYHPIFIAWLVFSFALFLLSSKRSLWPWASFMIVAYLITLLLNQQRLVYRVETGLWFYATILTIPLLKERFRISNKVVFCTLTIIALCNLYSYATTGQEIRSADTGGKQLSRDEMNDSTDYKGFWSYAASLPDSTIFLMSMNSYMRLSRKGDSHYIAEAPGSWNRLVSFGYWTPYFPDVETALHKRGIMNPMRDVVKENVFVVDEPSLEDFLERHYYDKVKKDSVRDFNHFVVYKYSIVTESTVETAP